MALAAESDEQLMQRVMAEDRESLSILVRRYANPLLTFVRRMTGDHHRSEDVLQDVFVAVWKSRAKFQYPRSFRAWVFGIAANKCRMALRQGRRPAQVIDESVDVATVAQSETPLDGVVATETCQMVDQAVMLLPPTQRTVVVLKLWSGFSTAAIAAMLERSESTVRSNLVHGLNAMRNYLEPRMR